jgi:hypothetical protein
MSAFTMGENVFVLLDDPISPGRYDLQTLSSGYETHSLEEHVYYAFPAWRVGTTVEPSARSMGVCERTNDRSPVDDRGEYLFDRYGLDSACRERHNVDRFGKGYTP